MFALDELWFGFQLILPFSKFTLSLAALLGITYTIFRALTNAVTCDMQYSLSSITRKDFYRLKNISPGDLLFHILIFMLFAYAAGKFVNGLVPLRSVGHDTIVGPLAVHRTKSTRSRGTTESYTVDVPSWIEKGATLSLKIDRETSLKLNEGAPIRIDTKIGLLGMEFYRARHKSFTFQKGYNPVFRQPE